VVMASTQVVALMRSPAATISRTRAATPTAARDWCGLLQGAQLNHNSKVHHWESRAVYTCHQVKAGSGLPYIFLSGLFGQCR
jgi:hypothetical protein